MNGAEITLVGNVVRFELSFTRDGKPMGRGAIAVNKFTTINGERQERTSYFDFKVFGEMAEHMTESGIDKGTRVIVSGEIRQDSWEASDGSKRSAHVLYVDEIGPSLRWATANITKVRGNGAGGNGGYQAAAPAAAPAVAEDDPFSPF